MDTNDIHKYAEQHGCKVEDISSIGFETPMSCEGSIVPKEQGGSMDTELISACIKKAQCANRNIGKNINFENSIKSSIEAMRNAALELDPEASHAAAEVLEVIDRLQDILVRHRLPGVDASIVSYQLEMAAEEIKEEEISNG